VEPAHTVAGRIGRPVSSVVKMSSYRSIMLRQEELAFMKAISSLLFSPALLGSSGWLCLEGRRGQWCLPGAMASRLEARPEPLNNHLESSGQAQSQRAGKIGRLVCARKQAPSVWRWVRSFARDFISHV
jgi:hypothetical protein